MADQYDGLGDPSGAQFARPQGAPDPHATLPPQPGYQGGSFPPPAGQPLDASAQPGGGQPHGQQPYGYGQQPYAAQGFGQPGPFDPQGTPPWTPQQPPVQQPPRRSGLSRLALAAGSAVAIAALAASSGLLQSSPIASSPGSSGGGQPAASAPAQGGSTEPGSSDDPADGTEAGSSDPQFPDLFPNAGNQSPSGSDSSNTGTSTSTKGQQAVTAAQSKGVVLIKASTPSSSGAGSGMILDAEGLVLTNYHVVYGSTSLRVTVASTKKTYNATVVGHDATNDVALLKLEGASGLETVTIDDDAVTEGDDVTAVGNANGQGFLTAAPGEITDTQATVTVTNDSASGKETLRDVYETDAQAQPGDSGGPMFDAETEVTGITTAGEQTYAGSGSSSSGAKTVASYAIPIARALKIVDQIKAGTESATVHVGPRPYLGITVASRSGATVATVQSGQPAAEAGITEGSELTSIADNPVSSQAEIAAALAPYNPGDTVEVSWIDPEGDEHTADVTLAASPMN